jgi:hypothetical protein
MSLNKKRIGKLPPKYSYVQNKYPEYRVSKCPTCNHNTFNRKFALLIFSAGGGPVGLGFTCKYCSKCELIIAHQHELEEEIHNVYSELGHKIINNEYYVVGTVDKKMWLNNLGKKSTFTNYLKYVADFKEVLELHYTPAG